MNRLRIRSSPAKACPLRWSSLLYLTLSSALFQASAGEIDFTMMSLEDLASVKVTSVSKKTEVLNEVPAAVSVIQAEDIRRSGALMLPEALRLVPGMQVGQVDSAMWAVSSRGFNDVFSQKLLVLIDGRSVYSPLFSGTFWQAQDSLLEDLDRIEVIRGPGGTVWGANAVNGVVNIVSKSAKETQGTRLTAGGGNLHQAMTSARYGSKIGDTVFFRIYGKYDRLDNSKLSSGGDARDGWERGSGGFRLDWEPDAQNLFTLQFDVLGANLDQVIPQIQLPQFGNPPPSTGYTYSKSSQLRHQDGSILGRWTHTLSDDSDFSIQTYYTRGDVRMPLLDERRDTVDLDLRHRFQVGDRQEIVWGGGIRYTQTELQDSLVVDVHPESRDDQVTNLFLQDEISFLEDRLRFTLGTKVEYNDYTGFEFQPGARVSWKPTPRQTLWASVARAVRTPSQMEHDGQFNVAILPPNPLVNPFPTVVTAIGNSRYRSENLIAYELGYRFQPLDRLVFDVNFFVNDYDDLRGGTEVLDLSQVPNYARVNILSNNDVHGITYGSELSVTWQATEHWRLQGLFSTIRSELKQSPSELTGAKRTPSIASPEYQASLRSSVDLGRHVEWDTWIRFVDSIDSAGVSIPGVQTRSQNIPSYLTFDLRVAWRPSENWEIALIGQNLADNHPEFIPTFTSTQYTDVGRSVYGKLTWKF